MPWETATGRWQSWSLIRGGSLPWCQSRILIPTLSGISGILLCRSRGRPGWWTGWPKGCIRRGLLLRLWRFWSISWNIPETMTSIGLTATGSLSTGITRWDAITRQPTGASPWPRRLPIPATGHLPVWVWSWTKRPWGRRRGGFCLTVSSPLPWRIPRAGFPWGRMPRGGRCCRLPSARGWPRWRLCTVLW